MNHPLLAAALALTLGGAACARPAAHREEPARSVAEPRSAGPSSSRETNPPPGIVDARAARALVAGGVRVVDVRTPAEFADGHVPGAINIPFDEIGRRAAEIGPKGTPVLLYCRSGRRSGIAADTLRGLGFDRLYDLQRYDAWVASQGSAGQ
jgi:rhodanese-related sulfurtransferase